MVEMVKRVQSVVIPLVLLVGLGMVCKPAAAAAPPTPIELRLSHFYSDAHHVVRNALQPFAKEVEQKSGGRIKVTLYGAETLSKASLNYDAAVNGVADISYSAPAYTPGRFKVTNIANLPFTITSAVAGAKALWTLHEKTPAMQAEWKQVKLLALTITSPTTIMTVKKQVRRLEDLKGMTMRSPGGYVTPTIKALGASPVSIPPPDVYIALQRGTVDGAVYYRASVPGLNLQEVIKYENTVAVSCTAVGFAMNLNAWKKLPADLQKVMEEAGANFSVNHATSYEAEDKKGSEIMLKAGIQFNSLDPAELARWIAAAKTVPDVWLKEVKDGGVDGEPILKLWMGLLGK